VGSSHIAPGTTAFADRVDLDVDRVGTRRDAQQKLATRARLDAQLAAEQG